MRLVVLCGPGQLSLKLTNLVLLVQQQPRQFDIPVEGSNYYWIHKEVLLCADSTEEW